MNKIYDIGYIKNALDYGDKEGFCLFPEIRDNKNLNIINKKPDIAKMADEIKSYAKTAMNEASPAITFGMFKEFMLTGNRLIYENAYFKRRKQLFSSVLAYILEQDFKYIPVIEDKLWEWCELYSWELPAHVPFTIDEIEKTSPPDETVALYAAENAFYFAEILSIIGDKLDELLVYRLKKEILRRVITPYKNNSYWWENARMNWAAVCAGSIGSASIYLIQDNEELAMILNRVLKTMDIFIQGFDRDGLTTEGLSYWSYGFGFYVYFAELLKERTCGKISLLDDNPKIENIASLPLYLHFPSELTVNFSDSESQKWAGDYGLFARLHKRLNIDGYNFHPGGTIFNDKTFKWSVMSRNIFWGLDIDINDSKDYKTGTKYFEESQWIVDRRKTSDGRFVAFAAKGGNNGEPHNHNDLGHFILHYDGTNIFIDIGSPEYVKEYFKNETRYDYLAASALGHSIPVINGCMQKEGEEHFAKAIKYEENGLKLCFELDLKKAYCCKELLRFDREFVWDYDNLELLINDKFEFDKPKNEIKELLITDVLPKLVEPGKLIVDTENCSAQVLYDKELQCDFEKCSFKNHDGNEASIYRITITSCSAGENVNISLKIKIYQKSQRKIIKKD